MSVTTHLSKRSLLTVLLCLGMAALVIGAQLAKPSEAQNQFAPGFKTVGRLGVPVEMREGTVMFSNIQSGQRLKVTGFLDKNLPTTATWIVIEYEFKPVRERESMDVSLYSPDNTRYRASLKPSTPVSSNISGEPGFTHKGTIAFEVPKSKLVGSRLVVGNVGLFGTPLWDSEAVIPLGIDQARADELVDDAPKTLTVGE